MFYKVIPITVEVRIHAIVPPINALTPSFDNNPFLDGIRAPMPPI